jgi:hypothetical protein
LIALLLKHCMPPPSPPRHFGISADNDAAVGDLAVWLQERRVATDLIKQHLARATLRMKHQADNLKWVTWFS